MECAELRVIFSIVFALLSTRVSCRMMFCGRFVSNVTLSCCVELLVEPSGGGGFQTSGTVDERQGKGSGEGLSLCPVVGVRGVTPEFFFQYTHTHIYFIWQPGGWINMKHNINKK